MSGRTVFRRICVGLSAIFVFASVLASTASADTIHVCWDGTGDYLTIQEGIDAALDGDEVVVCDGTYTGDGNRDIDFGGKAITVRSASGNTEACVIDCQGSAAEPHRGFHFHSGEVETSVVDGFTICNGWGSGSFGGGGILCDNASPMITNCTITGNSNPQYGYGGGICCINYFANATISNCVISNNSAL